MPGRVIEVEGGGHMLRTRALKRVHDGRAVLVNGKVRFLDDDKHLGYNTASPVLRWSGRKSGYAGPTVMQAIKV